MSKSAEQPGTLAGRTILVTGAAGEIGGAAARLLADQGASVVLCARRSDSIDSLEDAIRQAGGTAAVVRCDVRDPNDTQEAVAAAVDSCGLLDGAVLAAGAVHHIPLAEMSSSDWRQSIDLHLDATFRVVSAMIPVTRAGGSIVVVASTVAHRGGPVGQAHYVAAKAGVLGFVRAAARELGPRGMRINAVSPGFVDTGMNAGWFTDEQIQDRRARAPLGDLAEPSDVAHAASFLLAPVSRRITGQEIVVDGGLSVT